LPISIDLEALGTCGTFVGLVAAYAVAVARDRNFYRSKCFDLLGLGREAVEAGKTLAEATND
jgi:hypothetical protein